ncbi:MAG: penicillin-binding transpeptidase domain-containing protein [Vicinamibacterales bacterium]
MCTVLLSWCIVGRVAGQLPPSAQDSTTESCFLLYELGVGEVRRDPSQACRVRITPASTFKVPHALAALDAGVVSGPDEVFTWDGQGDWPPSSRRDHTLASALRNSVVWYFQRIAERLGAEREQEYLQRLAFGNMDSRSGPTSFWLGGSLQVTPEEQQAFWVRLYENRLPIAPAAVAAVKQMLIQPPGVIVNAAGAQRFLGPWPSRVVVSAKTGSATDRSGRGVRWLNGQVERDGRVFVFVSCVIGTKDLEANAAIDLAARALRSSHVL